MGTGYGNGFIFTESPNWEGISFLEPPCRFTAFQHVSKQLWFACLCDQKTFKSNRDLHPLVIPSPNVVNVTMASCEPDTAGILQTLDDIVANIDSKHISAGVARIRTCLEVARVTRSQVIYVEADDEFVDRACIAKPGLLDAFRIRQWLDDAADVEIRWHNKKLSLIIFAQDDRARHLISRWKSLKRVEVRQPTPKERRPRDLYSSAMAIWPKKIGDPSKLLGLGTPEPLCNIDEDYVMLPSYEASQR